MKDFKEMFGEVVNMSIGDFFRTLLLKDEYEKFTTLGKIFIYPLFLLLFQFIFWSVFIMFGFVALMECIFKIPVERLEPLVKRIEKLFVKQVK